MSADERLVVMLEARISEFEKRMAQAEGRGTRTYQDLRRGSRGAPGRRSRHGGQRHARRYRATG